MQRTDSLENILMLGKIEDGRRKGWQRMRWLDGITDAMDMSLSGSKSWWWTGKAGVLQSMGSQRVGYNWATELNWGQIRKASWKKWCSNWFLNLARKRTQDVKEEEGPGNRSSSRTNVPLYLSSSYILSSTSFLILSLAEAVSCSPSIHSPLLSGINRTVRNIYHPPLYLSIGLEDIPPKKGSMPSFTSSSILVSERWVWWQGSSNYPGP